MLGEPADARVQRLAAIEAPGERGVLAPRHVAELAPAPGDGSPRSRRADCRARAASSSAIADAQLVPDLGGGVIAKAGERRALHEQADAPTPVRGRLRDATRSERAARYSPKALRIHCTWRGGAVDQEDIEAAVRLGPAARGKAAPRR